MGMMDLPSRIIAGPCSAESENQIMCTARSLSATGIKWFRAGIWKPRTRPGSFEGPGEVALEWLSGVRKELGMKVCTEVASEVHVKQCLAAGLDAVWIGARTTANPFMVQEIAQALSGTDTKVLVKNPVNPDLDLWTGAVERLRSRGIEDIVLVHRGFSTFKPLKYHNDPSWEAVSRMRSRFPELKMICDPSHLSGDARYVGEVARHALDLGMDGLMIEVHCNPCEALSDVAQQLSPDALSELIPTLRLRSALLTEDAQIESLQSLRDEIDAIDGRLVELLSERMKVSAGIGEIKKKSNTAILQNSRWEKLLSDVLSRARELGLEETFVENIFNEIHKASIAEQNKIISDYDS